MNEPLSNVEAPPIEVAHASLERASSADHSWSSECPLDGCNGLLLVTRGPPPAFLLLAKDRCVLCGQSFVYTDIDDMRAADGVGSPMPPSKGPG